MLIATSCSIPFENFTWFLCRGVDCQATMDDLGHQVCLGWRVSVDRKEPGVIQALEVKAVYLAQMALQVDQVCNYLIVCTYACVCVEVYPWHRFCVSTGSLHASRSKMSSAFASYCLSTSTGCIQSTLPTLPRGQT